MGTDPGGGGAERPRGPTENKIEEGGEWKTAKSRPKKKKKPNKKARARKVGRRKSRPDTRERRRNDREVGTVGSGGQYAV